MTNKAQAWITKGVWASMELFLNEQNFLKILIIPDTCVCVCVCVWFIKGVPQ